ncbi:hypothetical protein [Streptodolium elevatio]|uniref:PE-PGRS family protein n=1 Tax=Streptodolium elevatio TaxID=3157996 RepID=A0ABV3D9I2_9ACTN
MKYTLNEKQLGLLRRVSEAPGTFVAGPQETNIVWALESRGLVKSSYARGGKAVAVTADGRFFLKHGKHPQEIAAEKERLKNDPAQAALAPKDGVELLARIVQGQGTVTVTDPGPGTRNRWKAAYYHALHHGHVPEGHKLRFTGRNKGDIVIRLLNEEAQRAEEPPPVPLIEVPQELAHPHSLVARAAKSLGRSRTMADSRGHPDAVPIHVSRPLADRALRIAQAVISEAERRGHEVAVESDLVHGETVHRLVIRIGRHSYPWEILERTSKVPHDPTPQEIQQQKRQPWLRIPKYDENPDGRLTIATPSGGYQTVSLAYSDASRWTLESRLGHFLRDVEEASARAEQERKVREQREAARQRNWHQSIRDGRERQVRKHRIDAILLQVDQWSLAEKIRAFCAKAESRFPENTPKATAEWLSWARHHADSLDPLTSPPTAPADPPATIRALEEHLHGDLRAFPWPYDAQGRWIAKEDHPDDG